jgi:DNA (cytosine-5)-methyltransferase 1
MTKRKSIPVIDLFAGPGGLGEGFSAFQIAGEHRPFHIALSIEKEAYAHQTLVLRSFFRLFKPRRVPLAYYEYLRSIKQPEPFRRRKLYDTFPLQAKKAEYSSLQAELGKDDSFMIRARISQAVDDFSDFILLGGPPCQAYSVIGRSRNRGNPNYDPTKDQRHHLYVEYLQVLADHHPAVFIMENVKGLLSATLENTGIFERILDDLRAPCNAIRREGRSLADGRRRTRYRIFSLTESKEGCDADPRRFLIKMERHGIPQARHRLIVVGIREDLPDIIPGFLPEAEFVAANRVISGLPAVRSGLAQKNDSPMFWERQLQCMQSYQFMRNSSGDTERIARHIATTLKYLSGRNLNRGGEFIAGKADIDYRPDWYLDDNLGGVCNHTTRQHIPEDLHRYLFASCFAELSGRSPVLRDFPSELLPKHKNACRAVHDGSFDDRFHVQLLNHPATTVTSHLAKDGHYFIHPDAGQSRSMTVREVARLQTFPDNYFFCGPRTAQYIQVGNAVPPLLAFKIAEIVYGLLKNCGVAD